MDRERAADPSRLRTSEPSDWASREDDTFALLDVAPGTYLLGVTLRDGTIGPVESVVVGDGLLECELAIGAVDVREDVVVRVLAPDGFLQLSRSTADGTEWLGASEWPDGRAVFRYVPAGRWRVVATEGPKPGEMTVDVPGDAVARWRPRPFDALRVSLDDGEEGYLRGLGLADGDLVAAIDGEELSGGLQIDALLAVARAHASVRLGVLRGGRRFDVTLYPRRRDAGGFLQKTAR